MAQLANPKASSYEIVEEIGRTATAALYRARSAAGSQPLLLLVFLVPLPEEEFVTGVRWNARTLAQISGDGIARVTAWGLQATGELYLAIEDVPGLTLATHMDDWAAAAEPLGAVKALRLVARLARTLHEALRLGVVHKDLQPGYVVVRPDGTPTVLGLELPSLATDRAEGAAGRYHSPEQREGRVLDGRSNIYSLGLLLYDLLTGSAYISTPPSELPPLEVVRPQLAPETVQVVRKSLEPASWARYQTYPAFLGELEDALAAEGAAGPAIAPSPARPRQAAVARPAPRRRLGPYLIAALVVLALAAALVGALLGSGLLGGGPTASPPDFIDSQPSAESRGSPTTSPLLAGTAGKPSPTSTRTATPTSTRTATATIRSSATPRPTSTRTPTSAPFTSTPVPSATNTPSPTNTSPPPPPPPPPPSSTATPTDTPLPTATPPLPGITLTPLAPAAGGEAEPGDPEGATFAIIVISLPVLLELLDRKEPKL